MLGGRDFDRAIVNAIVRPWLTENFDLPPDLQKDSRYRRVIRIAQLAAEKAKIDISTKDSEIIHAADDEIRVQDESGADIYLDVELTRRDLEALVVERVDETIDLARKVLKKNGYGHDDIDRVVLIGGPTKMPLIRERVPQQLGIAGDCSVDPMTAVALGAAIFAESRDWSAAASIRKPSRGSAATSGPLQVTYDYQARTTGDRVVLRVRMQLPAAGHELEVDSEGWTSGRCELADGLELALPLRAAGEHRFRVIVFDPEGRPVPSASAELTIVRTYASASGIPATHSLAVKVLESGLSKVNTLAVFLEKGTSLPAKSDSLPVRAARPLKPDEPAHIDAHVFQLDRPDISRPDRARHIGELLIRGSDLPPGPGLHKGDKIIFHWNVDEGGILTASLELPTQGLHFPEKRFFAALTEGTFAGEKGTRLAASVLDQAEGELEEAEQIAGDAAGKEIGTLRRRLEEQREQLEASDPEADDNGSVAEEARRVRCEIDALLARPEHRGAALSRELTALRSAFNYRAREIADADQQKRFDELAAMAAQEIVRGRPGFETAERQLAEMRGVMQRVLWSNPAFVAGIFNSFAEDGHLAIDSAAHERLVEIGRKALTRGDVDGLRDIVFEMFSNRISLPAGGREAAALATIMRA
jgi:molecular chaperone DnaK